MSALTLTATSARIPLAWATINGQRVACTIDPEWARAFEELQRRVGGTFALTNKDLEGLLNPSSLADPAVSDALRAIDELRNQHPATDLSAQEAVRAVEELRHELATVRGDNTALRSRLEELESEMAALRIGVPVADLSLPEFIAFQPSDIDGLARRVQQIEERLL